MNYCSNCGSELNAEHIDGSTRYVCSSMACGSTFWNNPVPVVAALVKLNDKYIIARNVSWPKKIFSVISGYLEEGENPEEAVLREVSEELGLIGTIKRHIGNYTYKESNQVILCYEVEASGNISTNHELAEIKQLSASELLEYNFSPLYITEKIKHDWSVLYCKGT